MTERSGRASCQSPSSNLSIFFSFFILLHSSRPKFIPQLLVYLARFWFWGREPSSVPHSSLQNLILPIKGKSPAWGYLLISRPSNFSSLSGSLPLFYVFPFQQSWFFRFLTLKEYVSDNDQRRVLSHYSVVAGIAPFWSTIVMETKLHKYKNRQEVARMFYELKF